MAIYRKCLRSLLAGSAAALALMAARPALGQDLLDNLRVLGRDAAKQYLDPAASSFGAAMNVGWFYRPPDPKPFGLDIDFGVVSIGSLYVGAPRHFETTGTFSFNQAQAALIIDSAFSAFSQDPRVLALSDAQRQALRDTLISRVSGPDITVTMRGPTAVGPENDSLYIQFQGDPLVVTVPGSVSGAAFDTTIVLGPQQVTLPVEGVLGALPFLPLGAPRITVGTVFGTQASIRWLPKVQIAEDMGDVGLFGIGVQHNLAVWFPDESPLDVTLDAHWQWLEVEDTFTSNAFSGGVTASKTFGDRKLGVIPYAGAAFDYSSITADYDFTIDTPQGEVVRHADFTVEGANNAHFTLGMAIMLFHVSLAGDYNFGEYNAFSASLMVML